MNQDLLIRFNEDSQTKKEVLDIFYSAFSLTDFDESKNNEELGEELRAKLQANEMLKTAIGELETFVRKEKNDKRTLNNFL